MGDFDTFWTHAYNGGYISGKQDRTNKVEIITYQLPGEHQWREAKSYRAAQQRITRFGIRNTGS